MEFTEPKPVGIPCISNAEMPKGWYTSVLVPWLELFASSGPSHGSTMRVLRAHSADLLIDHLVIIPLPSHVALDICRSAASELSLVS
jgi:hypothetical protein